MRFTAKIANETEVNEVIATAIIKSQNDIIYIMSDGADIALIHSEYKEEYEADGFWVGMIYENGHRVTV